MKIAVTTGTFHPESGGPPTYLHRLGSELVSRNHAVRLLTFGDGTSHRYVHPVTRVSRSLPLPIRLAAYTAHASRLVAWSDAVFVSDYGLPVAVLRGVVRRPIVLKVVGDFAWESAVRRGLIRRSVTIDEFQPMVKHGRLAILDLLQRYYATRADRVVVPSEYLAAIVRGWGVEQSRVRVIHNAVDVERFVVPHTQVEARAALGLPDGPVLLSVARLTPWKGVDHLIRSLVSLPALQLVHCGDGPEEFALRRLAQDLGVAARTHFRGRVDRDRIPLYFRAADVFALHSGYEGLAHVLLEAMAARVPVVVSDRGGNREVVQDGVTGRVVPYDRPQELPRAIAQLLDAPDHRFRLTSAAYRSVVERFGWSRLVEETLGVLRELV